MSVNGTPVADKNTARYINRLFDKEDTWKRQRIEQGLHMLPYRNKEVSALFRVKTRQIVRRRRVLEDMLSLSNTS